MEDWRNVPNYNGLYQISILAKEGKCRRIYKDGHTRILSNTPSTRDGRINWNLSINGTSKTAQAAKWIALTYPELIQNEYFEDAEIDHIDTDRLNNHPSNLRWVDNSGNQRNILTEQHKRDALINRNDCSKKIMQYDLEGNFIKEWISISEIKRQSGFNTTPISYCCKNKKCKDRKGNYWICKSAYGYVWKYKN